MSGLLVPAPLRPKIGVYANGRSVRRVEVSFPGERKFSTMEIYVVSRRAPRRGSRSGRCEDYVPTVCVSPLFNEQLC